VAAIGRSAVARRDRRPVAPASTWQATFDARAIDAIFADLNQSSLPGATVGIALEGKPVYRKGFGLANMELPVLLSPSVRMRIASITKQFASLAFMLLCEEGLAGIEDPITAHVQGLPAWADRITLYHLMGHVSGLRDVHDITYQFGGVGLPVTCQQMLSLYRGIDDVNTAPGTTCNYNNGGYLLLSAAIENISGQRLEDVFRQRIFQPIGLYDTELRRFDTDFLPNSATAHMTNERGTYEKSYIGVEYDGVGGLVSTVDDMLRWLAHMDAPIVGTGQTWDLMTTPQMLANGASTGYGLGIYKGRYRGAEILFHSGGLMGSSAHIVKVPAAKLDIVVMTNRHDVYSPLRANRILDACLPALEPVPDPRDPAFSTGTFFSPRTGRVIQLYSKEGQPFASIDGGDMQLVAGDDGVLRPTLDFEYFRYSITPVGSVHEPHAILFNNFGNVDELEVLEAMPDCDPNTIAGTYRSTAARATVTITATDGRISFMGPFGSAHYKLQSLADRIWRASSTTAMPWGGILVFDTDRRLFRFSTARNSGLLFQRVS